MKFVKKALFSAALSFTLITYLATLVVFAVGETSFVMTFASMSRILIFSAVLGLCGLLFDIQGLPRSIARLCHFVLLCVDFGVVLATLPYGGDFRMIFAAVVVFMLIYWLLVGLKALITLPLRKAKNND